MSPHKDLVAKPAPPRSSERGRCGVAERNVIASMPWTLLRVDLRDTVLARMCVLKERGVEVASPP